MSCLASLQALHQAGAYAKEEVCRTLVVLISNEPKLHAYAARQSFRVLQMDAKDASLLLMVTTTWFLGEPKAPKPRIVPSPYLPKNTRIIQCMSP